MPTYDKDKDYQKLIDEAAGRGDYRSAADYEQQRNAKIAGEGLGYAQTNKYQSYGSAAAQRDSYAQQLDSRPAFSYDAGSDPLYQQYRAQYMRNGNQAMKDTVGKAAAMTGGYGNSYAQTAGQQMYDQYMDQLSGKIPELYQLAYQRYADEGSRLESAYDRAAQNEQLEYNRLLSGREWDYQVAQDQQNREDQRRSAEEEKAYNLALTMLSGGVMPSESMLGAAGISAEDAQRLMQVATASASSGSNSGYSGYGGSTGGGKALTQSAISKMIEAYDSGDMKTLNRLMESYAAAGYDLTAFTNIRDLDKVSSEGVDDSVSRLLEAGMQYGRTVQSENTRNWTGKSSSSNTKDAELGSISSTANDIYRKIVGLNIPNTVAHEYLVRAVSRGDISIELAQMIAKKRGFQFVYH